MFLKQPADDEAQQEDQSEERSHGDHGEEDAEEFEAQGWDLESKVVAVGGPDVTDQNDDRQELGAVH